MIDPINLKKVEYTSEYITLVDINHIPEYDKEDYDLQDEKDFKKYIYDIEKDVRNSFEYQTMIQYLRNNMDMNKCAIYENVTNANTTKIKIEIHHSPFTLYDIANIVYNKRVVYGESLDIEAVSKEIMFLHYKLLIGLIPLAETAHELLHNSILFVPMHKVFGQVEEFINMYQNFMSGDMLDVLNRIKGFREEYTNINENNIHVLDTNYLFLNLEKPFGEPDYQNVVNLMNDKIKEIKENPVPMRDIIVFKK